MKEGIIKIKAGEDKEVFCKLIICAKEDCNLPSELHLTQDDKFYCKKHGEEQVANFIKTVAGLGGFV